MNKSIKSIEEKVCNDNEFVRSLARKLIARKLDSLIANTSIEDMRKSLRERAKGLKFEEFKCLTETLKLENIQMENILIDIMCGGVKHEC